jgi:hypothetical protein
MIQQRAATTTTIMEALLLHASGCWQSLERLGSNSTDTADSRSAALLNALCASPMHEPESNKASLAAFSQLGHRSACNLALSRGLMALAQEQLLLKENASARSTLRQALASSVNAVESTGIALPPHFTDQIFSHVDQLEATLASQLDLALASRLRQLPAQLILVLGMHRSGTSALSGLLVQAGLNSPVDLMPPTSANPRGYWESLGAVELSNQLLSQLGSHWSSCWDLPLNCWETHAEALKSWRSGMLKMLHSSYPAGSRAVLKDPRLCVLLPALQPWLESKLIPCTVFLPIRHPAEVAASLLAAEGIPRRQAVLLWLGHVLHAERNSRQLKRLIVDYRVLLSDPEAVLASSANILAVTDSECTLPDTWNTQATNFIDPQLQRQKAEAFLPNWVLDEQAEIWYELALHVYTIMADNQLKEKKRRAQMDKIWQQWLTLAP